MSYGVSEEAISALKTLADQLEEQAEIIKREMGNLKSTFEDNRSGLGAHTGAIQAVIDEVEGTEEDASIPVKKLVLKLQRAAAIRMQHRETNHYGGKSR